MDLPVDKFEFCDVMVYTEGGPQYIFENIVNFLEDLYRRLRLLDKMKKTNPFAKIDDIEERVSPNIKVNPKWKDSNYQENPIFEMLLYRDLVFRTEPALYAIKPKPERMIYREYNQMKHAFVVPNMRLYESNSLNLKHGYLVPNPNLDLDWKGDSYKSYDDKMIEKEEK